jgi:hypothetical protein
MGVPLVSAIYYYSIYGTDVSSNDLIYLGEGILFRRSRYV